LASTCSPLGVPGHLSAALPTPSPSSSSWAAEHPAASTFAPAGVLGHLSRLSFTPSLSVSRWLAEHPCSSTGSPLGVPGDLSCVSLTLSRSLSLLRTRLSPPWIPQFTYLSRGVTPPSTVCFGLGT